MSARARETDVQGAPRAEYVGDVIRRRRMLPVPEYADASPWPVRIFSLGIFELEPERLDEGGARRKASHQPLVLLKTFLSLGGRGVDATVLAKHLWPRAWSEDAENALKTTLHRLRRQLGRDDAILMRDNRLFLNSNVCWWDVDAFEGVLARAAARQESDDGDSLRQLAERALGIYGGPFLHLEDAPGSAARRERLRQQLYRIVSQAGEQCEKNSRWTEAEHLYRRALEAEPLSEAFYQRLIHCLKRQGREAEAIDVYHRCRHVLAAELGSRPSAATRALLDFPESA
jgi:two-component SAPR family response regulator